MSEKEAAEPRTGAVPAESPPVCQSFESHSICILLCTRCGHSYAEHGRAIEPTPKESRHTSACTEEGYDEWWQQFGDKLTLPGFYLALAGWAVGTQRAKAAADTRLRELQQEKQRAGRIFEAVVHTYEGDESMVPADLRDASFVKRARKHREAAEAERTALQQQLKKTTQHEREAWLQVEELRNALAASQAALQQCEQKNSSLFKRRIEAELRADNAKEELARLQRSVQQWQPIETAPKDGTVILTVDALGNVSMHRWLDKGRYSSNAIEGWYFAGGYIVSTNLTYWMARPDPESGLSAPALGKEKTGG